VWESAKRVDAQCDQACRQPAAYEESSSSMNKARTVPVTVIGMSVRLPAVAPFRSSLWEALHEEALGPSKPESCEAIRREKELVYFRGCSRNATPVR
jgi:hypothetical protein